MSAWSRRVVRFTAAALVASTDVVRCILVLRLFYSGNDCVVEACRSFHCCCIGRFHRCSSLYPGIGIRKVFSATDIILKNGDFSSTES